MQVHSPTGLNRGLQVFWGLALHHSIAGLAVGIVGYGLYLRRYLGPLAMPAMLGLALLAAHLFATFESKRPPGYLGHLLQRLTGAWIEGALPRGGGRYDVA